MALAHWIQQGTYTRVENLHYNKTEKTLYFDLEVYQDSTKQQKLQTQNMAVAGNSPLESINGRVTQRPDSFETQADTPPSQAEERWLFQPEEGRAQILQLQKQPTPLYPEDAVFDANTEPSPTGYRWEWIGEEAHPETIYKADRRPNETDHWQIDPQGQIQTNPPVFLPAHWQQWFSIEATNGRGTNLIRQIYLWLKTQPLFQGVQDA